MEITSIIILIGMIIIMAMFGLELYKSRLSINEASDENAKKKKNIILVVEDIIDCLMYAPSVPFGFITYISYNNAALVKETNAFIIYGCVLLIYNLEKKIIIAYRKIKENI